MDKEVLIHVRGLQTMDADGEQEPLEIVVPGQYYFRNGSHYLRYEEVMEDFPFSFHLFAIIFIISFSTFLFKIPAAQTLTSLLFYVK